MGLSSSHNPPPKHYVGTWSNGRGTALIIHPDGKIKYIKQAQNGVTVITSRGSYDGYGFWVKSLFSNTLEGTYDYGNRRNPVFYVNGDILKKQKNSSLETLGLQRFATTVGFVSPAMVAPMVMSV